MSDTMPTDPVLAAKWRAGGLKEWITTQFPKPLDRHLGSLPIEVDDALAILADATDFDNEQLCFECLEGRYIIVKIVLYNAEPDNVEYVAMDTLEQAQAEVEDHLFSGPHREDYTQIAKVFDTHLKKELLSEEVQKIEWKL